MANVIARRSNGLGVPLLEAQSISSDGTTTTVNFNNHVNLNANFIGLFLVKFPQVVATSAEPVQAATIGVPNSFRPIYLPSGEQATVAALASSAGPTYRLLMYDRVSDRLQLIA